MTRKPNALHSRSQTFVSIQSKSLDALVDVELQVAGLSFWIIGVQVWQGRLVFRYICQRTVMWAVFGSL
jgi:hypothetical protein